MRAWAVRRALRHRRTVSPVLEALGELCRTDAAVAPLLRAVAPTWLLQLPWLSTAEQRESPAARARRRQPGSDAPRDGRVPRSLHRAGPLLLVTEDLHWGDAPTIQLIDYIARRRCSGAYVAVELQTYRGHRLRSSAQRAAARAAPARPVRGDRARSVLGGRGRRVSRRAFAFDGQRRELCARVARAH